MQLLRQWNAGRIDNGVNEEYFVWTLYIFRTGKLIKTVAAEPFKELSLFKGLWVAVMQHLRMPTAIKFHRRRRMKKKKRRRRRRRSYQDTLSVENST